MNRDEQVEYLANIYHVITSDGAVERIEEKAFEELIEQARIEQELEADMALEGMNEEGETPESPTEDEVSDLAEGAEVEGEIRQTAEGSEVEEEA